MVSPEGVTGGGSSSLMWLSVGSRSLCVIGPGPQLLSGLLLARDYHQILATWPSPSEQECKMQTEPEWLGRERENEANKTEVTVLV